MNVCDRPVGSTEIFFKSAKGRRHWRFYSESHSESSKARSKKTHKSVDFIGQNQTGGEGGDSNHRPQLSKRPIHKGNY